MPLPQLSGDYVSEDLHEANAADNTLVVRFSLEARPDSVKSAEEGRAVYRDKEFITIHIPGDKTLNAHRPVMASDKARFPRQYAHFKNNMGEIVTGTPLIGWPLCSEAQRKELEFFHVRTVEQLASIADGFASNMMGVVSLKQAAQKFIAQSKETAVQTRLTKELAERDTRLAEMQEQLAEQAALLKQLASNAEKAEKAADKAAKK